MKTKKIQKLVYGMLAICILLIAYFFVPWPQEIHRNSFLLAAFLGVLFGIAGIALIVLTIKQKIKGKLKVFLLITGIAPIGVVPLAILHNVFYAFAILTEHIAILNALMEFLHAACFLLALLGCPIAFIIGAIGSIILLNRKKKRKK